jgi:hypothetical protein
MVKSERDADAKVPTKVVNTDIDAMTIPMTSNIPPSPVSIIVNGNILLINRQTVKFFVTVVIEESMKS